MIWLLLEALASPDGWAIHIAGPGEFIIEPIADLPANARLK